MVEKILIVDDSGVNRTLLATILKKAGFEIAEARSLGVDRVFLECYLQTGARRSEIYASKWEHVNFERRAITLSTKKTKDGSIKYLTLPMNGRLPIPRPSTRLNLSPHRAKTLNHPNPNQHRSPGPKPIPPHSTKTRTEPNSTPNNWKPSTSTSNPMSRNSAPAPLPCRSQPSARPNASSSRNLCPSHPVTK
jgi:integrase